VLPGHTPVPALAAAAAGITVTGALLGFMAHKQAISADGPISSASAAPLWSPPSPRSR
jgi:hypothetical protein